MPALGAPQSSRPGGGPVLALCFDGDGTPYHPEATAAELWHPLCSARNAAVSRDAVSATLARVSAKFVGRRARVRALKLASPAEAGDAEESLRADHDREMLASWGLERYAGDIRRWWNRADLEAATAYDETIAWDPPRPPWPGDCPGG